MRRSGRIVQGGSTYKTHAARRKREERGSGTSTHTRVAHLLAVIARAACDAFILLSRKIPQTGYYEGFGIVYREAMACGKPVIVSREAGFRDYVVDGENGVLVDPTDAEEIVRVCTDLLSDPAAAAQMGRRAVAFASESADWSPLNELA